jgi:hypothetical protein
VRDHERDDREALEADARDERGGRRRRTRCRGVRITADKPGERRKEHEALDRLLETEADARETLEEAELLEGDERLEEDEEGKPSEKDDPAE